MSRRTFETRTPFEALLVEQALTIARQPQQTADAAPDGSTKAATARRSLCLPKGRGEPERVQGEPPVRAAPEGSSNQDRCNRPRGPSARPVAAPGLRPLLP
jgi:hypothetical protein